MTESNPQWFVVGYERGKAYVKVWILGAERVVPVSNSQLEPQEVLTRIAV